MKNFRYRILYGRTNYITNHKLNILLFYLEEIGIKSISTPISTFGSSYSLIIEFNDGTVMDGWNANRWYAFLNQGEIKFSNGERLTWSQSMPKYEILYKIKKIVINWEKEEERKKYEEDSDKSKYLPKQYLKRIERLKKLKNLKKISK